MIIAIDGPSAAGKSTTAKALASKLGFSYIDTGAMYRAVAWKYLQSGKPYSDESVIEIAKKNEISFSKNDNHVCINGQDIADFIRTQEVSDMASKVSAIPEVREILVSQQRRMGQTDNVILDGRDIGTVVFPDAECKIFLTATLEERAYRRKKELEAKGEFLNYTTVKNDIAFRDKRDSERAVSPLRKAEDAHFIDNTNMNVKQVVKKVMNIIEKKKESSIKYPLNYFTSRGRVNFDNTEEELKGIMSGLGVGIEDLDDFKDITSYMNRLKMYSDITQSDENFFDGFKYDKNATYLDKVTYCHYDNKLLAEGKYIREFYLEDSSGNVFPISTMICDFSKDNEGYYYGEESAFEISLVVAEYTQSIENDELLYDWRHQDEWVGNNYDYDTGVFTPPHHVSNKKIITDLPKKPANIAPDFKSSAEKPFIRK